MQHIIYTLLCLILLYVSKVDGESHFGYISYVSYNFGDDIQSIAAKRFLPKNSFAIDREFIGNFNYPSKVNTIVNGWYMHSKDFYWYLSPLQPPAKSWPPPFSIEPLLISIHFTEGFLPFVLTNEGIEYLKKHGPVGTRDYYTLGELQKRNIPSYFSGCLTLTLENPYKERNNIIYAVDIDEECINYIRSKTKHPVVALSHIMNEPTRLLLSHEQRLIIAEDLLEKYRKAKCVITSRLHASMPCLALETPVLLIPPQNDPRFDGLKELTRNCSREELLRGAVDFNFNEPTENPTYYRSIRENLIKIVTDWVNSHLND